MSPVQGLDLVLNGLGDIGLELFPGELLALLERLVHLLDHRLEDVLLVGEVLLGLLGRLGDAVDTTGQLVSITCGPAGCVAEFVRCFTEALHLAGRDTRLLLDAI